MSVEIRVEKLNCRNINRGKFKDANDVTNQYFFYQSYQHFSKISKKFISLKEKIFLCISSGSKINRSSKDGHNIPQICHDQDKPVGSQRGYLTLEDNEICMRVSDNFARQKLQKKPFVQGLCLQNLSL